MAIADADGTGKITLLPFQTKGLCPGVREVTFSSIYERARTRLTTISIQVNSNRGLYGS